MTPEKKDHLKQCVRRVSKLQIDKYIKGQKEHGGKMWLKTGMLHAALEEVADLANYLPTIELQIEKAIKLLKAGHVKTALVILEGIISQKIEMPELSTE
jgi:hypothetical protein